MNIPRQPQFLYKGIWSPEGDLVLVETLIRLKNETMWTLDEFSSYFLLTAMKEIERKVGISYTEWDLKTRVKILLLRYRTFKEVSNLHETHWNMGEKVVTTNDDVWKQIFEKNPYAKAYYYEQEPIFPQLAMLFGMDDVKMEQSPTVIVISDTTVALVSEEGGEEVNSPAVVLPNKVKRKLFFDEGAASDRESTNQPPNRIITPGSGGRVDKGVGNSPNYAKDIALVQVDATPQRGSPITSSCASSSPAAWWRHPDV